MCSLAIGMGRTMGQIDNSSTRDATVGSLVVTLEARLASIDAEEAQLTRQIRMPKTPVERWTYAVVRRNDISVERAHLLRKLLELGRPPWKLRASSSKSTVFAPVRKAWLAGPRISRNKMLQREPHADSPARFHAITDQPGPGTVCSNQPCAIP